MSLYNLKLSDVANFCSTHVDLMPVTGVGGYKDEPFLSLANDAISDLLIDANDWKPNRNELGMLVTAPSKQDYLFAGASVFSLGGSSQGWAIDLNTNNAITVAASVVTVTTIENHRFNIGDTIYLTGVVALTGTTSKYNSIFTDNGSSSAWSNGWVVTGVTSTTLTFAATTGQNNSDIAGAPGITNYGFLTSASMVQMNDTSSPQYSQNLQTYREQPVSSRVANPEKVAVMTDLGTGVIKVRFFLVPGSTIWGAKLVQQAATPLKVSMADNWAPFPDSFSSLIRQAMIYRIYRYLNDPRADKEYIKYQAEIKKAQGGDDAEQTSVYVQPEEGLMDSGSYWSW